MRYLACFLFVFSLLNVSPLPAQNVLFEQPPVVIEGTATQPIGFASTIDVNDETIPNRAYDNFVLTQPSVLTGISWAGLFAGEFNPDSNLRSNVDFEIKIYRNLAGNKPDVSDVVYVHTFDAGHAAVNDGTQIQKVVVPNATPQDGGAILDYMLDLDSIVLAAGTYWLSVRAEMDFPSGENFLDPGWAWLASETGDNLTYNYDEELDWDEALQQGIEPGFRVTSSVCASANLAGCDAAFTLFGSQTEGLFGDFNASGALDIPDIDLLAGAIRGGDTDLKWDVNQDGSVNADDHVFWISDLKKTLMGDADFNFSVEFSDFLKLSSAFGSAGPNGWSDGNFDTDTDVDFADFLQLSSNFGGSAGAAASAQSVPEPSSLLLAGFAVTALSQLGRRRNRR